MAVHELHRIFQAPVAVHEFAHRGALGAMRAAIDRAVETRFLSDPDPIGDLGGYRAADRAMGADVLADRDLRARGWRRTRLGFAHADERQCTERRETAGHQTRTAQEAAAVEAAVRLVLQRGRKGAAVSLAFCPLDQHGRLPSVTIDSVVGLDVLGLAIPRLALLFIGLGVGNGFTRQRSGARRRGGRADSEGAEKLPAAQLGFGAAFGSFFIAIIPCPMCCPSPGPARRPRSRSR